MSIDSTFAQSSACSGGSSLPRAEGLVTSPSLSGKFETSGACVIDSKVAFAPFKIPTYEDLKSLYFDQNKSSNKESKNNLPGNLSGDKIFLINSDLSINASLTGSGTQVIFVNGALNISKNITFPASGLGGLVFVVKDKVVIDTSVTRVDAVIIAEGIIYTALDTQCSTPSSTAANALTINGSLIALNENKPIKFCRMLSNNNNPAEIINTQPKYLVILRNLMSDTYQRWSEVP